MPDLICPKCGSRDCFTERPPYGITKCVDCRHEAPTKNWLIGPIQGTTMPDDTYPDEDCPCPWADKDLREHIAAKVNNTEIQNAILALVNLDAARATKDSATRRYKDADREVTRVQDEFSKAAKTANKALSQVADIGCVDM